MRSVHARRKRLGLPALGVCAWITSAACSDSEGEKLRTAQLSQGCTLNSHCANPFVCTFERCHRECFTDRDCKNERCVISPAGDGVCQLPVETSCANGEQCRGDQLCGPDGKCRDGCTQDGDCVPNQVCSKSGHCVSTDPAKDQLDEDGNIIGQSGSGGSGGTTSGSGGGGSGSGPGGNGGAAGNTVTEVEPNENQDQPSPYTAGTRVGASIGSAADRDYLELSTPPGATAGGFYRYAVTDVGSGAFHLNVYSETDHGQIFSDAPPNPGASVFGYLAAAPEQSYHFAFSYKSGTVPFPYVFNATFTAIEDSYEPNDVIDQAKPVAVGSAFQAYFFAGYASSGMLTAARYYDWYSVPLAAGAFRVAIDSVPTNIDAIIEVYAPSRAKLPYSGRSTDGAGFTVAATAASAGTYYLRVAPGHNEIGAGSAALPTEIPDHFTRPYTLTISQP